MDVMGCGSLSSPVKLLVFPDSQESKVGEFEHKSAVHYTVGGLHVAVAHHGSVVEVAQALEDVHDQGLLEVPVNLHLILFKDILVMLIKSIKILFFIGV